MHQAFAATLDTCYARIRAIQTKAHEGPSSADMPGGPEAVAIAEEVMPRVLEAGGLAGHRAAQPQGVDRAEGR